MISAVISAFKRPAEGILNFWRKECLFTKILNPPLLRGPTGTDNSLAPPFEGCCLQAMYRPCPVLSESIENARQNTCVYMTYTGKTNACNTNACKTIFLSVFLHGILLLPFSQVCRPSVFIHS